MKNKIKLLSALLIVIFSISLCTVPALATDPTDVDTTPVPTESIPVETDPPVTDPPSTEPTVTEAPTTQPTTKAPTTKPTYRETEETVYTTASTAATTRVQNTTSVQYYTNSTQQQYDYDYQETQASTPPATMTTERKQIDEDTLDKSDWEEIRNELMNSNGSGNGADSFDFIKNNTKREDDGMWLLVGGILLIIVGVGIIGFYIAYVIRKKRYLDKRNNSRSGRRGGTGSGGAAARNPRSPRGNGSDKEGYYRSPKDYSSSEKRQVNRRSKFDTGEIEIPRNRYSERPARSSGSVTRSGARNSGSGRTGATRSSSPRSGSGTRYR